MGKRRSDADTRRFFDEFQSVRVSRFRAMGTIDPAKNHALIPFPNGTTKLIATKHTWFAKGGGWSFFVCPKCARRAAKLYLIGDRPLCTNCCGAMNVKHASSYGFGLEARRKAADKRLDQLIAKLESPERLRLRPAPASWRGRAQRVYNSDRLAELMRRRMISLRLEQLATINPRTSGGTLRGYRPNEAARELIDLTPIGQANTAETLQKALDKAQITILTALDSDDPQQRINAAKLMLNTKQARDRGLA